jgi:murein DD-endopeptidase MepM/ murein hydrolase activator NlpD
VHLPHGIRIGQNPAVPSKPANRRKTAPPPRKTARWLMPVLGATVTLGAVALASKRMDRFPWEFGAPTQNAADRAPRDGPALSETEAIADAGRAPTPDEGASKEGGPDAATEAPPVGKDLVHTVEPGQSLGSILGGLQVSNEEIQAVAEASKQAGYDLVGRLKAGHDLHITLSEEGLLDGLSFMSDPETLLRLRRGEAGAWSATQGAPDWDRDQAAFAVRIEGTLWDACMAAKMDPADAHNLIALFDREVDLGSELQPGDRVSVLFEALYSKGEFVRHNAILAARFRRGAEVYERIPWPWRELGVRNFDPSGKAHDPTYLRSPLDVARMSSGVGRRNHPVLGGRRRHSGIDYPAPHGTPVRAIGDGTVKKAGDGDGYGNLVIVRHGGNHSTRYGHLARFAQGVKPGVAVRRGQVIGFVGSTGLSSGSHLHFELRKGDREVDFNGVRPGSAGTVQLDGAELKAFLAAIGERLEALDQAEARALVHQRRRVAAVPGDATGL